jgi:hypothetical protein
MSCLRPPLTTNPLSPYPETATVWFDKSHPVGGKGRGAKDDASRASRSLAALGRNDPSHLSPLSPRAAGRGAGVRGHPVAALGLRPRRRARTTNQMITAGTMTTGEKTSR